MSANPNHSALLIAGVMTGNSLDAADVVLTRFHADGRMSDEGFVSSPFPEELTRNLRRLRHAVEKAGGDMERVASDRLFNDVSDAYIRHVADAVSQLPASLDAIDAVGLHGQTCAHCPPSAASSAGAYTVQIADAAKLADLIGVTVLYDFRSDDVFAGGEGAPFAPLYFLHMAKNLRLRDAFPALTVNAGNTGNLALIYKNAQGDDAVLGWDAGPYNHFPDMLMRREKKLPYDKDGKWGRQGKVDVSLLHALFRRSAVTAGGENFLELAPPKSSDPLWYRNLPELFSHDTPFVDRLRTAEYFSAYILYHTLGDIPQNVDFPDAALFSGGGRHNKIILESFEALAQGDDNAPILPEHRARFHGIRKRGIFRTAFSESVGIDGSAAEARIFAVAAHRRIIGAPFSLPSVTGCRKPTLCGLIRFPRNDGRFATANLREHMRFKDLAPTPAHIYRPWSRASAGSTKPAHAMMS